MAERQSDKDVQEAVEEAIRFAVMGELDGVGLANLPVFQRRKDAAAEPPYLVVLALNPFEPVPGEDFYELDVKVGLTMLKNAQAEEEESAIQRKVYHALCRVVPGHTDHVRILGFGLDGGGKVVDKDGLRGKIWTARTGAHMR